MVITFVNIDCDLPEDAIHLSAYRPDVFEVELVLYGRPHYRREAALTGPRLDLEDGRHFHHALPLFAARSSSAAPFPGALISTTSRSSSFGLRAIWYA